MERGLALADLVRGHFVDVAQESAERRRAARLAAGGQIEEFSHVAGFAQPKKLAQDDGLIAGAVEQFVDKGRKRHAAARR